MNALVPRGLRCPNCAAGMSLWARYCGQCGELTAEGRREAEWLFESPVDHRFEDDDQEEERDAYERV